MNKDLDSDSSSSMSAERVIRACQDLQIVTESLDNISTDSSNHKWKGIERNGNSEKPPQYSFDKMKNCFEKIRDSKGKEKSSDEALEESKEIVDKNVPTKVSKNPFEKPNSNGNKTANPDKKTKRNPFDRSSSRKDAWEKRNPFDRRSARNEAWEKKNPFEKTENNKNQSSHCSDRRCFWSKKNTSKDPAEVFGKKTSCTKQTSTNPFKSSSKTNPFNNKNTKPAVQNKTSNNPFSGKKNNNPFSGEKKTNPFGESKTNPFCNKRNANPFSSSSN